MAKKKPDDQKHFSAAIPARAVGDKRLKGLHWSTLSTIALHDRMGRNGQGCWAGDWRLKDIIGCDYARLSTTLTELYEWGYIDRRPQPKDRRKLTYFVVYDDAADGAVMKAADSDEGLRAGKESGAEGLRAGKRSEGDGLRAGKESADDRLHEGEDAAEIIGTDFSEAPENSTKSGAKYIPRSGGRHSPEGEKSYSPEGASPCGSVVGGAEEDAERKGDPDGAYLAQLERWLKSRVGLPLGEEETAELHRHLEDCRRISDARSDLRDEAVYFWAERLMENIWYRLERYDQDDPS